MSMRSWICAIALCMTVGMCGGASSQAAEPRSIISFRRQQLATEFFSEGANFGDLNRDGKTDLVAGPYWFEGPDFAKRHEYYPPKPFDPLGYSDNFFAFTHDFNADGWNDILILGFPGKEGIWFENPQGGDGHWKRHVVIQSVDNESPTFTDITGDGQPEVVCSQRGFFGYAAFDPKEPAEPWTFHVISDNTAGGMFTHGLGVGDVNGDGRPDLMEKSGWWEQPASLADDPLWKKHAFAFADAGGAQMYAYDVNDDGRNDVITSLQAHGYGLVWWEQLAPGSEAPFKRHTIVGNTPADSPYGVVFSQLHAVDLVDIDGDGLRDIITGKRYWAHGPKGDPEPDAPAVLYWFQLQRSQDGVEWIPHKIDDKSGVGTQVVAADYSGDKFPDIVVGNKQGIFVHTQERKPVSEAQFQSSKPQKRRPLAEGLAPEEAAAAMTVPPGFRVQLFAGEPDVQQPIAMAFDDRGRLWVAEAYSYPIRVPDDQARDRILILEDADHDGKFDKRTVFHDRLNLVSGIEVGFGGVWVGAAPYLLFIPDADGDDRPDGEPKVMLDGWGYQDTHETLNSFIWGPDGWLYGCHGVFTHSLVGVPGAPDDERVPINAGVWRFHPTRHTFEVFAQGTSNPWGVDFNSRGHAFITACVIPHLYHLIQGGRYQRQAGAHFNPHTYDDIKTIARHRHWVGNQWNDSDRARSDNSGGGHAHAGAMLYQGGAWPEEYHDQLFMNNIHGARLNLDLLTPQGSGYEGNGAPDFLLANDRWSQVIYLTYGPDGQVTMIDWYDKNQCHHHNNAGHDRTNGRIFKIVHGDVKPAVVDPPLNLAKLGDEKLIELLSHPNEWYSRHARRLLQERAAAGKLARASIDALHKLAKSGPNARARLRGLWALHAVGGLDEKLALALLKSDDVDLRSWSVQFLAEDGVSPRERAALLELAGRETEPVALAYIASAAQRLAPAERLELIEPLLMRSEIADDHNLPLLAWYAIEPCVPLAPERTLKLAEKTPLSTVARFIVRRAGFEDIAYQALFTALESAPTERQAWMLDEIVGAMTLRGQVKMPSAWTSAYPKLAASPSEKIREQADFLAVKFGDQRVFKRLRATLADRKLDQERRKLALDALLAGKDRELPKTLYQLLDDEAFRSPAILALAAFDDAATPAALLGAYATLPDAEKQAAISVLTSRAAYALALLTAIEEKRLPRTDVSAFTARQIAALKDAKVTARLNEVWGTLRDTAAEKAEDFQRYRELLGGDTLAAGNLPHGRELFNKTCAACHKLFGEGKVIGPDLTGSNRANLEYLLENLLDPSAVVGRDYQMTTFETDSGRVISGLVLLEAQETIKVKTPTDEVVLVKSDIVSRTPSEKSVMPDDQLKQYKPEDIRDLVAYLRSPGQVPLPGEGPYLDPETRRVAGAIEGETLKILAKTGGAAGPQDMRAFPLGKWSGNQHLWWTGGKPGDRLELGFQVESEGKYEVFVVLTKAIDFGEVRLTFNGGPATGKIDCFNDGVINTPPISLGTHELRPGDQKLTLEITGANAKAVKAYMAAVDYVWLKKKP